ncbi:thioredoxin-like 1-1, chloroplastic [Magnolia sinica]|uniref:thioredoxin-like 1-1, chloroplastic n=1 Tax=Magnolia sinica TaxID=86752 RepID=UPI002657CF20|nr:thioredoxin-like 1-1, chloroplastic [Magnolia sinica]
MAASLRSTVTVSGSNEFVLNKDKRAVGISSSHGSLSYTPPKSSDHKGRQGILLVERRSSKTHSNFSINAQASVCIPRSMRWWEKSIHSNMNQINSAQHLVDSLLNAGDKLVIIDFYSPGCGGCKALHPKICQIAEMNPNVQFLQVNYEEHKSMCYSLNVHVLPFFRFYRGVQGRLCSFSCTNATIKKFKDALAKHGGERCSLGPARGLEESELLSLAAKKELAIHFPLRSATGNTEDFVLLNKIEESENAALAV